VPPLLSVRTSAMYEALARYLRRYIELSI